MGIYIPEGRAEEFVEYLRTLPDEAAVALAKIAVRETNRHHNLRQLTYCPAFVKWATEAYRKGILKETD
jgi:hypothetical protein